MKIITFVEERAMTRRRGVTLTRRQGFRRALFVKHRLTLVNWYKLLIRGVDFIILKNLQTTRVKRFKRYIILF